MRAPGAAPKVLLVDEPFAGLDPRSAAGVAAHLRALTPRGVGVLAEDRKTEGLALALPIATNIALPQLAPHLRAGLLRPRRLERAARAVGERVHLRCH